MFDRRYPNLVRPQDAPEDRRAAAVRVSNAVCSRASCHCAYDKGSGSLFFFLGEPSRGIAWTRFYSVKGDKRYSDESLLADAACKDIYRGRIPDAEKLRKVRWAEEQDRLDKIQEREARIEDAIPDAIKNLKRARSRRGMGRHSRPSAVIDKKV